MSETLPVGWEEAQIRQVADVNPANSLTVAEDTDEVSFIPMAAMEALSGKADVNGRKLFVDVKKGFTRFRNGDLLFAKITPCMENGKLAVVEGLHGGIGCGSTEFHVIRPKNGVAANYLRYWMLQSSYRQKAERNMQGAVGQRRVPSDYIKSSILPVAPSREQERIVSKIDELLSEIEEGERALEKVRALVERYRQSVLKAAVTGELTRDWREKHKDKLESGETLLAHILKARREAWETAELAKMAAKKEMARGTAWKSKYKKPVGPNTEGLPELPSGWFWASLDQLSWDSNYGTSHKCGYDGDGVAVLRIPNVRSHGFSFEDMKFAYGETSIDPQEYLAPGDLLVIRTNGSENIVGMGAVLLSFAPIDCYFASYLIRFRLCISETHAAWVNHCWDSRIVRSFVEEHRASSAGQYNISQSSLRELAIPIPPESEAEVILDIISQRSSSREHALATVRQSSGGISRLRQSVLHSAFNGSLVPQDPIDEPASVLLERIAADRASASSSKKKTAAKPERRKKV